MSNKKLGMWKRVIDYDRFRTPSIEEFVDGFEYEDVETAFSEYTNIGELITENKTWIKTSCDRTYNYNNQPEYYKEMLEDNEARVKKEIPTNRLKTWLKETPLKFLWHNIKFIVFPILYNDSVRFVYYMNAQSPYALRYYLDDLKELDKKSWFNWKYFEGTYNGTEKEMIYDKHLSTSTKNKKVNLKEIKKTNLNHLDDLREQVKQAHMNKPNKTLSEFTFIRRAHVLNNRGKYKRKPTKNAIKKHNEQKTEQKLAEENRLAQMKLYNPKKGNRKQRRNKYNKWGQPGDRYAKLQQIAIKEKLIIKDGEEISGEKVVYKNGRNILVTIDKFTKKEIPKMEPITSKVIIPKFMYESETTDDKTRIIKKDKYVIKTTTGKFHRCIKAEYKTITQHLYPQYLCKLFKKRKEQVTQLQKELKEMQKKAKKDKQKKITKTTLPKKKVVAKSRQKKGD